MCQKFFEFVTKLSYEKMSKKIVWINKFCVVVKKLLDIVNKGRMAVTPNNGPIMLFAARSWYNLTHWDWLFGQWAYSEQLAVWQTAISWSEIWKSFKFGTTSLSNQI